MKRLTTLVSSLLLVAALAPAAAARQGAAEDPLTNASVIKLARAGFREKTIISIINSRPARFDLAPDRLIELKKRGVSEKVILAMVARNGDGWFDAGDDDDWGSDDIFKGGARERSAAGGAAGADPGGVNIFGSSGGSRGRVRSRGQNGGVENDTETVGSATVRIIRPPSEAGGAGAPAKLERTPTLTNESVVGLVEAGFSEGTIVRRIEQSPVEFDLSADKLAELRRKRVTEPVIAAMRAAMGEEGGAQRP
jgi:hypothetical protein